MIELAFTISSYRLHDFVKLGIKQINLLSPDSPILVSDDPSPESEMIKSTSESLGAAYKGASKRRGHFAGDLQSMINALAFAKAVGADVAVKVSQRFIFKKHDAIECLQKAFENPDIMVATPGQPRVRPNADKAARGFGAFTILTDIVAIRVGCISPQDLLVMYRERILREKVPWASFIECAIDELHSIRFPGKTVKLEALTNPTADPIYLRRYQASEVQYRTLALSHGFNGLFPLNEWNAIERQAYLCKPVVV